MRVEVGGTGASEMRGERKEHRLEGSALYERIEKPGVGGPEGRWAVGVMMYFRWYTELTAGGQLGTCGEECEDEPI